MKRRRLIRLGIIISVAIALAVGWWLYQPSFEPFKLPPEMNVDIVHAEPGLEDEGCGACHAEALAADDDDCKSCHTETENTPQDTFTGPSTDQTFNNPHHLLTGLPDSLVDNPDAPGCVGAVRGEGDGCHAGSGPYENMSTDARYAWSPTPDRDYCHDPSCHATMNHSPTP